MELNRRSQLTLCVALPLVAVVVFATRETRMAAQAAQPAPVSFTKDIAPILQRSCQSCHRPGSVAPMSLITYDEVRPWARSIKQRTSLGSRPDVMPPWFIDKTIGIQQYKDDMSLSDAEIGKIAAWVDAGAPRGNPADMPPPLKFGDAKEWRLGTPDLIVSSPIVAVDSVQADWWGPLAAVPTGLTEDRYVASVEIKETTDSLEEPPSTNGANARKTVGGQAIIHHASYTARVLDEAGKPASGGAAEGSGEFGTQWPVHEVGRNPDVFDPDAGKLLPARSHILFPSVHLHANGRRTKSHMELGFRFHLKGYRPKHQVKTEFVSASRSLDIKGMESNQRFEAFLVLKENTKLTIFEPHLHAAGVRMCLEAIWSNTTETLTCAGYNHGWVRIYTYADDAQPLLPKGTILRATSYFDTTPANKNVSDPRNWSGLGNRSIDNMAAAVVTGVRMTDDEFEREVAQRSERIRQGRGATTLGCPRCGHQKTVARQ